MSGDKQRREFTDVNPMTFTKKLHLYDYREESGTIRFDGKVLQSGPVMMNSFPRWIACWSLWRDFLLEVKGKHYFEQYCKGLKEPYTHLRPPGN